LKIYKNSPFLDSMDRPRIFNEGFGPDVNWSLQSPVTRPEMGSLQSPGVGSWRSISDRSRSLTSFL